MSASGNLQQQVEILEISVVVVARDPNRLECVTRELLSGITSAEQLGLAAEEHQT